MAPGPWPLAPGPWHCLFGILCPHVGKSKTVMRGVCLDHYYKEMQFVMRGVCLDHYHKEMQFVMRGVCLDHYHKEMQFVMRGVCLDHCHKEMQFVMRGVCLDHYHKEMQFVMRGVCLDHYHKEMQFCCCSSKRSLFVFLQVVIVMQKRLNFVFVKSFKLTKTKFRVLYYILKSTVSIPNRRCY